MTGQLAIHYHIWSPKQLSQNTLGIQEDVLHQWLAKSTTCGRPFLSGQGWHRQRAFALPGSATLKAVHEGGQLAPLQTTLSTSPPYPSRRLRSAHHPIHTATPFFHATHLRVLEPPGYSFCVTRPLSR